MGPLPISARRYRAIPSDHSGLILAISASLSPANVADHRLLYFRALIRSSQKWHQTTPLLPRRGGFAKSFIRNPLLVIRLLKGTVRFEARTSETLGLEIRLIQI